jgi:hypothetical protein
MATVKLVLDKRRKKKSGAYPLVIRIRHLGKYIDVSTNHDLHEHQFDDKRELIIGNKSLNRYLQRQVDNCIDKIIHLEQQHDEVSINQIKALFGKTQKTEPTIAEFWHKEATRLTEIGNAGNAGVYLSSLRGLKRVMNLDIPFKELKHKHIVYSSRMNGQYATLSLANLARGNYLVKIVHNGTTHVTKLVKQ